MSVLAPGSVSLRALAFSTLALAGCQSILGLDTDRPLDAGATEAAAGSGADAGGEGGGALADASSGGDADAGTGATDAPDDPATDAAADGGPTFLSPVQIDASSIFNARSVATTAVGGAPLTPMDGPGTSDDNDFPTQSQVLEVNGSGSGLPDDGSFAASGSSIPGVHLAWNDTKNALDSIVVSSTSPTPYTLAVPPARYTQLQIYATGTGGASTVNYTLTYSDSSSTQSALVLPDWCLGQITTGGQYVLASVDRVSNNGTVFNGAYLCHIYALDLNPDPTRILVSFTFSDTGSGNTSYFVFYGATAW